MAAEAVLTEQMEKLKIKQAELKSVSDKLQALNDHLVQKQIEKKVSSFDFIIHISGMTLRNLCYFIHLFCHLHDVLFQYHHTVRCFKDSA